MRPFLLAAFLLSCSATLAAPPAGADDETPSAEKPPAVASKESKDGEAKPDGEKKAETEKKPEAEKKPDPPTVEATKGPFTVHVEASGSLDAVGAVEVAYEPKAYAGELEVVEASGGGTVAAGDVLLRFSTEKIDEALDGARRDLEIAKRSFAQKEEEQKRAAEAAALARAKAQQEKRDADDALARFLAVEKDLRTHESETRLQGTRDNLDDQREELDQLKKMYGADDLVEGTEEIVLRRTERNLARSQKWFTFQETRHRLVVEVELPRDQRNLELAAKREAHEWDRLVATQDAALEQGRLEAEKARAALEKQSQTLAKLEADRTALVVKAPSAGTAVAGALSKGKWTWVDDPARAYERGKKAKANQALWTVVTPGAVYVRVSVPEAHALSVEPGQAAEVTLGVEPNRKVSARVLRVARVSSDGNYEAALELSDRDARWMPGVSAKAKIRTAEKPDAVTVPVASVVADGEKRTVHCFADGKASPREVETGATSNGRVEIVKGLEGGERVLKSPPKP